MKANFKVSTKRMFLKVRDRVLKAFRLWKERKKEKKIKEERLDAILKRAELIGVPEYLIKMVKIRNDINTTHKGESLMYYAILLDDEELFKGLLEFGAHISSDDTYGILSMKRTKLLKIIEEDKGYRIQFIRSLKRYTNPYGENIVTALATSLTDDEESQYIFRRVLSYVNREVVSPQWGAFGLTAAEILIKNKKYGLLTILLDRAKEVGLLKDVLSAASATEEGKTVGELLEEIYPELEEYLKEKKREKEVKGVKGKRRVLRSTW